MCNLEHIFLPLPPSPPPPPSLPPYKEAPLFPPLPPPKTQNPKPTTSIQSTNTKMAPTFFDTAKRSFKDVPVAADGGVPTTEFLEAAESCVALFGPPLVLQVQLIHAHVYSWPR